MAEAYRYDRDPSAHTGTDQKRIYDPVAETPTSYLRDGPDAHPPLDYPAYKSTQLRHPKQPLIYLPHSITEITGPQLGRRGSSVPRQRPHRPGRRTRRSASGSSSTARCATPRASRCATRWWRSGRPTPPVATPTAGIDGKRRWTPTSRAPGVRHRHRGPLSSSPRSSPARTRGATTTTPGAPRTSTSRLMGRAFAQRLVTQMYFPGDPFFPYDPIFNSVRDETARERMVSRFDIHRTVPNWAHAYEFDIVLRGPGATPFEEAF